jgi:hypothetical protein
MCVLYLYIYIKKFKSIAQALTFLRASETAPFTRFIKPSEQGNTP